jgi:5-methylcytosine-specific restriction endonuclease McrA
MVFSVKTVPWNKGLSGVTKWTEEQKSRQSKMMKARGVGAWLNCGPMPLETRLKISRTMKGKPKSEHSNLMHSGERNHFWRGGVNTYERKLWHNRQRRVMKIGNGGSHTLEEWINVKVRNAYLCAICGEADFNARLTEDHIIPLTRGGSDDISNIQPLCNSCNCKKRNSMPK